MKARAALPLGMILLLAGCAGGVSRIGGAQYESYYDAELVRYAARTGQIPVVVAGNPFGDDAAVVAAMRPPAWLADARFVPVGTAPDYYRVVLVFGQTPKGWSAEAACKLIDGDPAIPAGRADRLQATFCGGARPVSSLFAEGPSIAGASDPAFRKFLGQVVSVLLPAKNPRPIAGP